MQKIHEVKILPEYYTAVDKGIKTCELRKDDRGYNVGDLLMLREWQNGVYTGRKKMFKITYILRDCGFGLQDGYAILCIKPIIKELNFKRG